VSEAGEGWSDSRIAEALNTSIANILRTRRQLVEEGFEAVLTRKYNPNSARPLRRSQTARLSWEKFIRLVARFFPPIRTLHPLPCHRFDAKTQGRSPVR
jgi:hypothetical protein